MNPPFQAYHGNEPFLFISYSHRDSKQVFEEITWLRDQGFNIWYDEGIEAGREWRDEIATAISKSSVLIYFVTPNSVASENCRNEVNFAADEQIAILTVYLSPTDLPGGLRLTLSNKQAIKSFELTVHDYQQKLIGFLSATQDGSTESKVEQPSPTRKQNSRLGRLILFCTLAVLVVGLYFWFEPNDKATTSTAAMNEAQLKAARESGQVALGANDLYLHARENLRARTESSLKLAKSQFEESLALDPEFAPAWSDLARTIVLLSDVQYGEVPFVEAKVVAEEKLAKAFELEPELATGYATEGFIHRNDGNQMEALSSFHRAIAVDPNNAYAHFMISEVLMDSGNFNESLAELEVAYKLDSVHPIIHYRLVQYYLAIENFSGLKGLFRPDQTLLTGALIDFRMGRTADGVVKAVEYLTVEDPGFAGVHLRMELARRYYYQLNNIDMAQQAISETNTFAGRVYFQALDYPEVAYQLLRRVPDDYHNRFSKFLLARSQILTGRHEGCLTSLDYQGVNHTPIQGQIFLGLPGNELSLAFFQAYCLSKLGRQEEAMALQRELLRYHQLAVQQGEPPGYFRNIARLEMLAGNFDAAILLLEEGFKNHSVDWTDLANPWYDQLREMPRFQTLQSALYQHMNQQRVQLGWPEVKEP